MKRMMQILCLMVMMSLFVSCAGKKDDNEVQTDDAAKADIIKNSQEVTLSIQEIEDDYFLAVLPWPSPIKYKVFAKLSKDFCVGDYVDVYYTEETELEENSFEITAELVETSDFELDENKSYKPVIYLYPTEKTEISVLLDYNGILTHTYPEYRNGWNVTADSDGTIFDSNGTEYPYLFWEGDSKIEYDMSKGFCVSGTETQKFLKEKLTYMGLNEHESTAFIEFWAPFMEENPYNKITFQTTAYTDHAKLIINPAPDSMLRVYMVFQPLKAPIEIEEQSLNHFERVGFTVVEWGGSIIK